MNVSNVATAYGIVLGVPRSGTTFLMDFFDTMPRTEAVSGNLLPTAIPHLFNQEMPALVRTGLLDAFRMSLNDYLASGAFNARAPALRKAFRTRAGFVQAMKGQRPIDRLIYKEPFLAFAPQYAYEGLPEARIIYLVRDGRDVADSLVRTYDVLTDEKLRGVTSEAPLRRQWRERFVPWWVSEGREDEFLSCTTFVRATWMWSAMVSRCHGFFSRQTIAQEGRVLEVRYEDLVRDPRAWGNKVTAHFGAKMTPLMQKQIETASKSSIGIHKRRDADDVKRATEVARRELQMHDYL